MNVAADSGGRGLLVLCRPLLGAHTLSSSFSNMTYRKASDVSITTRKTVVKSEIEEEEEEEAKISRLRF